MRLPGLWARSKHCEEGISAGNETNSCQPGRIHTLRTGNDDSVANLNIGDRNSWQSLEHVVDVEAGTATGTARSASAFGTLRSIALSRLAPARRALTSGTTATWSGIETHSHFSRKSSQHCILLDHDR